MDCDENDFQSQNLHLVGEGNNKFPPVLTPYALPKFDFDDSLHGSLRFDSLVGAEVFLGIGSNEDSQWIEDYSRGSSGIQFSSSAVEPCSISRRNNVWSEATSSESVEMLLKSVGQEDIIPLQTNSKESDACDELGCIIKQMDPNLRKGSNMPSSVGDLSQPMLPLGNIPQDTSVSGTGDRGQHPDIEGSSFIEVTCGGASGCKVDAVVGKSLSGMTQKVSVSGVQVDSIVSSEQNIIGKSKEMHNEDAYSCVNLTTATDSVDGSNVLSQGGQLIGGQILDIKVAKTASPGPSCFPKLESMVEAHANEANSDSVEDPHGSMKKDDCSISKDLVIDDRSEVIMPKVPELGSEGNVSCQKHGIDSPSGPKLIDENLSTEHSASVLPEEANDGTKEVDEGSKSHYVSENLTAACAPAKDLSERNSEINLSSYIALEFLKASETNTALGKDDVNKLDQDAPVEEAQNADMPRDIVDTDPRVSVSLSTERGLGPLSSGEHRIEGELMVLNLKPDAVATAGNGSVDSASVPSGNGDIQDAIDKRTAELPASLVVVSGHSHNEPDITDKTSNEASSLDVRTSSQLAIGECSFSGVSGQMPHVSADKSLSAVDACNAESQSEPQSRIMNKAKQGCTEIEVSPGSEKGDCNKVVSENDGEPSQEGEPSISRKEMLGLEPSAIQQSSKDNSGNNGGKNETAMVSGDTGINSSVSNNCGENADPIEPVSNPTNVRINGEPSDETEKVGMRGSSDMSVPLPEVDDSNGGKDKVISGDLKQFDVSKDSKSFTFQNQVDKGSLSSTTQATTLTVERSLSTSGLGQSDQINAQDQFHGSLKVSDVAVPRGRSKGNSERKPRRSSTKATGKEAAKKGNPIKESAPGRIERGEKISTVSPNPSGISQLLQPAAMFQQPFTDIQQVQLRAQIFVYGALIQGIAPDEACMISAFGGPDGGRNVWHKAWRLCFERLHGQKVHPTTPETPLPSCTGSRAPDQATKQGGLESKVTSTVGRVNGKGTPSTIASPIVPFSSPLWSMPTPSADILQPSGIPKGPVDFQRAISPLHHQNTPMRNFVGHSPSWISQAPYCGPWVTSPQTSTHDSSARPSIPKPVTEPVRLTPVKDSPMLHSSVPKHITPGPAAQSGVSAGVLAGASATTDVKNVSATSGQPATEPKSRRRKKTLVSESPGQIIKPSRPQTEAISMPVAMTPPIGFVSRVSADKPITSLSSTPSSDLSLVNQDAELRISSDEILGKVKEARVQAEEAAALATAAVNHSQEIWNRLDKQRNSGLLTDNETKLASAAVAIAAAAAVAKAAAAAANVASNAALQAKLMADEAVVDNYGNGTQSNASSLSDGMKNLLKATLVSILKGDNGANSSSAILGAARETARKRVEAASAASKRAENMDAIVKAAELAAQAVSQAGKIVAMGDPLPLSELVAAGPEGYWKTAQGTAELVSRSDNVGTETLARDSIGGSDASARLLDDGPSNKTRHGKAPKLKELSNEDRMRLIDVLSGTGTASAKDAKGQNGRKASDSAKTIRVVPESEMGTRSSSNDSGGQEKPVEASEKHDSSIKEGSHVEVFKDNIGLKAAWFSADVLSLNDGKAYVCFTELTSGEDKLKEWVELKSDGDKAPKIRVARPITAMPFEGTRKRRRAAMGDHRWSIGDKVDAWMRDSWWEGVITEKNKKDDTTLRVHFPVHGETVEVRAWYLRPSLVWKDGEWVEWFSTGETSRSSNGVDAPQEKRPRVRSPAIETKEKDMSLKGAAAMESEKPEEPTLLDLAAGEKIFNMGKSSRDNKPSMLRMTRTGLQKEGSKVIFGVPKPGKKRKFMDVSKHYVADQSSKPNDASDSVKLAKYLMSQGSSQGWKNSSKPGSNERQAVLPKPKVPKFGRSENVSGRTIPQKDRSSSAGVSAWDDSTVTDNTAKTKDPVNLSENTSKHNHVESSEGAAEGPFVISSLAPSSDTLASKKTSNSKSELASKGKIAPARGKLGKIEEDKILSGNSAKLTSDIVEPRRSNRRIQPTSRLLEGLQTSLMVPKLPPVASYDKGHRSRIYFKRE